MSYSTTNKTINTSQILMDVRTLTSWAQDSNIYPYGYLMAVYVEDDESLGDEFSSVAALQTWQDTQKTTFGLKVGDGERIFSELPYVNGTTDSDLSNLFVLISQDFDSTTGDVKLTFKGKDSEGNELAELQTLYLSGKLRVDDDGESYVIKSVDPNNENNSFDLLTITKTAIAIEASLKDILINTYLNIKDNEIEYHDNNLYSIKNDDNNKFYSLSFMPNKLDSITAAKTFIETGADGYSDAYYTTDQLEFEEIDDEIKEWVEEDN